MRIRGQIITAAVLASLVVTTISLAMLVAGAICTEVYAAAPTPAQMEAVQNCAAKQGVNLPAPPSAGGHPPNMGDSWPQGRGDHAGNPPPRLTDAEKTVVDACFKASGLAPPQPPHGRPMREDDED